MKRKHIKTYLINIINSLMLCPTHLVKDIVLPYPLFSGYSDWFILDKKDFEKVSYYFGVFAAMGLFVEIAIPTAMFLCCNNLKFIEDLKLQANAIWSKEEIDAIENKYNNNIQLLIDNYPKDTFYIHPIKLSKWK